MAKVKHVKSARKDYPAFGIKKGDSYYYWQLYKRPKQMSKERPKQSQLTGSYFLQTVYQFNENSVIDFTEGITIEDINSALQARIEDVETLRDETQEKLDSMPDQLQYAPTGELLQSRIDSLEEMISEYQGFEDQCDEDSPTEDLEGWIDDINSVSYEGE